MKPTLILSLLISASAFGDKFTDKYNALKKAGNQKAIEKFLEDSSNKEADNPNYYATAGNYWWGAATERVQMGALPAGEFQLDPNDLSIIDPKTGKKVGSIGSLPKGQSEKGKKALGILKTGAKKFPNRADISMGLAHLQKESKLTEDYVTTLVGLLGHAKKSPRSLKWMNDEKLPKPAEEFLPESIQPYSVALFKQETPATDKLCSQLLDAITNTYPDHPYAYNLKAALADANGKSGEALKMLEIAYTKNPNDSLVLSNLAASYVRQDKKDRAIRAYKKLLTLKIEPGRRKEAEAALKELSEKTK
ncbi:MAG: hypothetical protein ABF391_13005 [Akkermansiaceae bacterium]